MSNVCIKRLCSENEGIIETVCPHLKLFNYTSNMIRQPFLYGPSLVILREGIKTAHIDDRVLHFGEGAYLIVAGSVPLECEYQADGSNPVLGALITFDPILLMSVMSALASTPVLEQPNKKSELYMVNTLQKDNEIEAALDRILSHLPDPARAQLFIENGIKEIYYHILMGPQGNLLYETFRGGRFARIHTALEYVRENFHRPIRVETLAKLCNMSPTNFYRVFKEQTGDTPLQLLKKTRLSAAKSMLERNDATVSQIANQVGYESASHFGRDYRLLYGHSPKTIRA